VKATGSIDQFMDRRHFSWQGEHCFGCDSFLEIRLQLKMAHFFDAGAHQSEGERGSQDCHSTDLFSPAFGVLSPETLTTPLVFNSPHSGRTYPAGFVASSRLDAHRLRLSEDCFVDRLFDLVPQLGAPFLRAHFPRAYVDVNRQPYELDPAMFSDKLPSFVNTRSLRVAGGLGTIARIVSENEGIYSNLLTFSEAEERISTLYYPYHTRLEQLLKASHARFGASLLVDCHSMPSNRPFFPTSEQTGNAAGKNRPDFVLGDRFGRTCPCYVTDFLEQKLTALGYTVVRNKPYAGGFITQKYGIGHNNQHAIQIEINRALYLDENRLEPHRGFEELQSNLMSVMEKLAVLTVDLLMAPRWAAE